MAGEFGVNGAAGNRRFFKNHMYVGAAESESAYPRPPGKRSGVYSFQRFPRSQFIDEVKRTALNRYPVI